MYLSSSTQEITTIHLFGSLDLKDGVTSFPIKLAIMWKEYTSRLVYSKSLVTAH